MARRITAYERIITGQGAIPRPNWLERLLTMRDLNKTRVDLAGLTPEQLADIGISRAEAAAEAGKAAWDGHESFFAEQKKAKCRL